MKQTCVNCSAEGRGKGGTIVDNTPPGWVRVMSTVNAISYLCETCGQEACELTLRLQGIVKDEYIHFYSLVVQGRRRLDP